LNKDPGVRNRLGNKWPPDVSARGVAQVGGNLKRKNVGKKKITSAETPTRNSHLGEDTPESLQAHRKCSSNPLV